jgi:hypothetical protein
VLSGPLRALAGSTPRMDPVTLPDSEAGLATFGRFIPRGALVILVAVCDENTPQIGLFDREIGQALYQIPAECAVRLSSQDRYRVHMSSSSDESSSRSLTRIKSPRKVGSRVGRGGPHAAAS